MEVVRDGVLEFGVVWGREGWGKNQSRRGGDGGGEGRYLRSGKEWWCGAIPRWLGGWGWEIGGLFVDLEVYRGKRSGTVEGFDVEV